MYSWNTMAPLTLVLDINRYIKRRNYKNLEKQENWTFCAIRSFVVNQIVQFSIKKIKISFIYSKIGQL